MPQTFAQTYGTWAEFDVALGAFMTRTTSVYTRVRSHTWQSYRAQLEKRRATNQTQNGSDARLGLAGTTKVDRQRLYRCRNAVDGRGGAAPGCSAGFMATYDYNKTTRNYEVKVSNASYGHNHELNQRTWRRDPVTRNRLWDDNCEVTILYPR